MRILVVEDEAGIRLALKKGFQKIKIHFSQR